MYAQLSSPVSNPYASNPVNPWWWVAGGVVVAGGVGALAYRHFKKQEETQAAATAQAQAELDDAEGDDIVVEPEGAPFDGVPPLDTTLDEDGRPQVRFGKVPSTLPKQGPVAKPYEPTPWGSVQQAWFQVPQQPDLGGPFGTGQGKPAGGGAEPWTQGAGKSGYGLTGLPSPLTSKGWYPVASFGPVQGRVYAIYMEQGGKGFRWAIAGTGPAAGATASKWKPTGRGALKQAMTRIMNYEGWPWAKKVAGVIYLDEGFLGIPDAWYENLAVRCTPSGQCDLIGASGGAGEGGGK